MALTWNLPTFILGLFAIVILKSVLTALYNVFIHPLRRFPGSKLAAATNFVRLYYLGTGREHQWIADQHNKYGAVVRLGPNRLSYSTPDANKDIYGHQTSTHKANVKDPAFFRPEANGVRSLISMRDPREHGRVRRIFSHAFSDKALKDQEPLIRTYVDLLVQSLRHQATAKPGEPVDLVKMYNCTTFDIMGDLCFGEPLGLVEKAEYNPWVEMMFGAFKAMRAIEILRELPVVATFVDQLMPRSLVEQRRQHFQYSADRVDRRLQTKTDRPDIWTLVLNKQEQGDGISLDQMHSNSSLFMIAGTETTATLLSGLTYHLIKAPEKLAKLVAEIRTAFASEDDLTIGNLARLEYLQAVLDEGLRIYPPAATGSPRIIPEGGNVVCGEWLPAGTHISVAQYGAYHLESNFHNHNSFVPERWIPACFSAEGSEYKAYESDKRETLQPFGVGPHACLGRNLAYHEMRLILAKVLFNFDLSPHVPGGKTINELEMGGSTSLTTDWINHKAYGLWEKPPLYVKLTPVTRNG